VDTTHAYNAGLRDGNEKGVREGRREGYADGVNEGEREGYRRGTDEGNRAGRESGYRDGYGVDQAMGTQNGNATGQTNGVNNGTEAGKRRCYDEGYTNGYNTSFEEARKLGLQDAASYSAGYAKGQADAATIEAGNGQKAGYQAGFSQRETELESASFDVRSMGGTLTKGVPGVKLDLNITEARYGYATPEERQAYDRGYKEGYQRGYRRAYEDAKREGYNERFTMAYRRAYDAQYSISYRNGYAEGKTAGYQAAYNSAYNSTYARYYEEYSSREYADQRALGLSNGRTTGRKEGFEAGCAENTKRGYDDGYQKTAAEVYPAAFEAGKQSGIAAADKYYRENAVLKVADIAFYDENGDGKFEANENVMLKAEVRNFGFKGSETVAITIKSERGEIQLVADLKAAAVSGRTRTAVNLNIGKLYDVVAPDADALNVKFMEKGTVVGERRQLYTRTNPNKVGTVEKDDTPVRKNSNVFSSTVAKLNKGTKVIIIGEKDYYTKVRKSAFAGGEWNEGYVYTDKLTVQ
jgi:flagellar biosynthesis/type III secretory pathway protein FliH